MQVHPVLSQILDMSFADALHGWVLGVSCSAPGQCDTLTLRRTVDGGKTWQWLPAPPAAPGWIGGRDTATVHAVRFSDTQFGWIYGGALYATQNGGQTWVKQHMPGQIVDLGTDGATWAVDRVCSGGRCRLDVLITWPGTARWHRMSSLQTNGYGFQLVRTLQGTAWLVISEEQRANRMTSSLFRTTNGAQTWQRLPSPCAGTGPFGDRLAALDSRRVWLICPGQPAAGSQMKWLYHSTDAGSHWTLIASTEQGTGGHLDISGYVDDLAASTAGRLWLGLGRGTIERSTDAGRTWRPAIPIQQANPGGGSIGPIIFVDSQHGWVATWRRTVYRTSDGGRHWNRRVVR
jgi:photosystem II stability/assembly factor-like uncharacterized protein